METLREDPFVRSRHRWTVNIKIIFREKGCGDVNGFILTLVRNQWQGLVKTEMNLQVPLKVEEFLTS
jgi:hypothetical protein